MKSLLAQVEIEAPEGTEVQVNDGGYYDPQPQTYWYQQPSYYSTQGGTLRYCFTGDTRVRLANGRQLRMDELEVGEWVKSCFSGVIIKIDALGLCSQWVRFGVQHC